jgi:hypothetical protein
VAVFKALSAGCEAATLTCTLLCTWHAAAGGVQWVEVKMRELGVLGNEFYKVVTLLDHAAMLTVNTDKYGVFDCKPLAFIWAKFPEHYNEDNTVMLDDLRWAAAGGRAATVLAEGGEGCWQLA